MASNMATKKPKSFLSYFLKFLTIKSFIFSHFTKFLSFYLVFIFILGFYTPNCEATFYFYKYNHYHIPRGQILLHRLQRSPFMPPTVTSFKPSIKKSSVERTKHLEKVSASKVLVVPPIVASQSLLSSPSLKKKVPVKKIPNVPKSESIPFMRITYPRPPMVVPYIKKEEPKINNTGTKLTITPQNDQRSDNSPNSDNHPDSVNPLKDKNAEAPRKEIIKPTEKSPKNESKKLEAKSQEIDDGNDAKGLAGLNEVLEGLDITIEDLHQVLKRVRIPMETFLEFIDREKTKDEIMEYLNLPESLKPNFRRTNGFSSDVYRTTKTIPYSTSGTYDHKYNRVDRQKELVDHLPITEIVHEVPMNSQVTYKDPIQHKSQSDKYPPKKNYKIASENEFVEKKYKSKRYKPNHSEKNPYLMNSDISTLFPPKDSPITTSFWPPKKKATKPAEAVKSRASIVSLTIEERIVDDSSKILHETTLPIRNKVFRTDSEMSTSFPKSSKNRNQSSYEQQQANIDDILPVRGVLMFGGVFAIVGLLIIGAFIIHGTVKYNRKPSSSTYELNEHQDGSTSSVLSNT